jgi:AcrR family transcriptional regulator
MSLTKTDWTEAALLALARDGLRGVAVEPLARQLETTKGSFYWHFADRGELIAATIERWEQRATTEMIDRIQAIDDPRERLTELATSAFAGAARGNAYAAMLAAAPSDPRVRAALERVTRRQLAFLEDLYADLGVRPREAADRARVAFALYLGISDLRLADPASAPAGPELDAYLDAAVDAILPAERAPALSPTKGDKR